jgi:hypothetical protein
MQTKSVVITIIISLIVGGGAFYGGTVYEKSSLTKQGLLRNTNVQLGNRIQGQGRPQGTGGFNRGGENSGLVTGEIISKDDRSVTVKTRDGGSKIVYFSDSTEIGKIADGSSVDLEDGKQVMINGKANQDGSFTAENIQIRPTAIMP